MRSVEMAVRSRRVFALALLLRGFAAPPFRVPMLVAALGLILSAVVEAHADLPLLCGDAADHFTLDQVVASSQFLLAINPPTTLAFAWLAMLVAMMTPLTAVPLAHVRASSLAARRWRAETAFLLGYFGVWGLAGLPLLLIALMVRLIAGSPFAAFVCVSLLALGWSASRLQQATQNRAHRLRRIGLFGLTADRDCLVFGAALGGWCLASCWAWMLVPLFVPYGHVLAMIAVSIIVMAERLRGPGPLRWRMPVVLAIIVHCWSCLRAPFLRQRERV